MKLTIDHWQQASNLSPNLFSDLQAGGRAEAVSV
jgi:hypothetical protein